jgi:hypothetical protein
MRVNYEQHEALIRKSRYFNPKPASILKKYFTSLLFWTAVKCYILFGKVAGQAGLSTYPSPQISTSNTYAGSETRPTSTYALRTWWLRIAILKELKHWPKRIMYRFEYEYINTIPKATPTPKKRKRKALSEP